MAPGEPVVRRLAGRPTDGRHALGAAHRRDPPLPPGRPLGRAAGQAGQAEGHIGARAPAPRAAGAPPPGPSPTAGAAVPRPTPEPAGTDDSPLRSAPAWPAAFQRAGR